MKAFKFITAALIAAPLLASCSSSDSESSNDTQAVSYTHLTLPTTPYV